MKISLIGVWIILLCAVILPNGAMAQNEAPVISLHAVNAEVSDVLAALGSLGKTNIVADVIDAGKITVRFDSVSLYQALELIAKTKGLAYKKVGDVVIVCAKGTNDLAFDGIHLFKLSYANPYEAAEAVSLMLDESSKSNQKNEKIEKKIDDISTLSTAKNQKIDYNMNKRLQIDNATHSLLFLGSDEEAGRIRDLLQKIDIPYPQVFLEAKVIAVNKDEIKTLGLEWSDAKGVLGAVMFGYGIDGIQYAARLNALVAHDKAEVLARPNIMAIDGKEAVINIGGEVPVPTVSVTNTTTNTTIKYRESGIILRYMPRINKDGFITATVYTEVSSPVYVPEVNAYRFNKRSADTSVRLKDGETMVIGGLIGSEEIKSVSKMPLFGDLPILGQFFRRVKTSKNESEIMIFLTAHIVK